MDIGAIASQVFGIAAFLILVAIGLRTQLAHSLYLARHWRKGLGAFAALYVIVPAAVMLLCYFMPMPPAVEAALIALSVSPMLPTLPNDLAKLGAPHAYSISLEVLGAVLALVAAPIAFAVVSQVEGIALKIPLAPLVLSLAMGLVLPLGIGIVVNIAAPAWAARIADPLTKVAGLVILVCVLLILWKNWSLMAAQMSGLLLLALVLFVAVALLAGHLLGAPDEAERSALALTAASRHVGFALALGAAVAPKALAVVGGTILIYFVLRGFLVMPYVKWATARRSGAAPA
jgi:bile acid:Na+ symporter, BASS family